MTSDRRQIVRYEDRRIVGYPEDVSRLVDAWRAEGRLLGVRAPVPVPGSDRWAVAVRLRADRPAPVPVRRSYRVRWVAAGAVAGTGVLAGLGWLAYLALVAVLPYLAGTAVLLLLLCWVALGQSGSCPGLHCPGCKCGRG